MAALLLSLICTGSVELANKIKASAPVVKEHTKEDVKKFQVRMAKCITALETANINPGTEVSKKDAEEFYKSLQTSCEESLKNLEESNGSEITLAQ